jgi:pimeloyl-ACP methyl ester carboxylesterase
VGVFCLVHGSTQDARCWDLLAPHLERQGHRVVRATLPTDEPLADTNRYAASIRRAIDESDGDVVIVGHSASGFFLPVVAAQRPVARMVFLAATIPVVGKSFRDQVLADPAMFQPDWRGKDPSIDDDVARSFLFHDCAPRVTEWAMGVRIRLPLQSVVTEPCPLARWPDVPASYVVCADDRTISPDWSRRAARERLGVEAIEIPGGHCPYLSRPAQLADVLSSLVPVTGSKK